MGSMPAVLRSCHRHASSLAYLPGCLQGPIVEALPPPLQADEQPPYVMSTEELRRKNREVG